MQREQQQHLTIQQQSQSKVNDITKEKEALATELQQLKQGQSQKFQEISSLLEECKEWKAGQEKTLNDMNEKNAILEKSEKQLKEQVSLLQLANNDLMKKSNEEKTDLEKKYNRLLKDSTEINNKYDEAKKDLTNLRKENSQLSTITEQQNQLKQSTLEVQMRMKQVQEKNKQMKKQLQEAQETSRELQLQKDAQIQRLQQEHDTLQQENTGYQGLADKQAKELMEVKENNKALTTKNKKLNDTVNVVRRNYDWAKKRLEEMEPKYEQAKQDIYDYIVNTATLKQTVSALRTKLSKYNNPPVTKEQFNHCETQRDQFEETAFHAQQHVAILQTELKKLKQELEDLRKKKQGGE